MNRRLLLFTALLSVALITSCKDDEPKIDPIVGEWELGEITITNPPSTFTNLDGYEFASFYGETEYLITFNADKTYLREIDNSAYGDLEDEGTWELDGDEMTLEFDDGDEGIDPMEFEIIEDIDDKLTIAFGSSVFALSDAIITDPDFIDTVTTAEIYNKVFDEYAVEVQITMELEFDKN